MENHKDPDKQSPLFDQKEQPKTLTNKNKWHPILLVIIILVPISFVLLLIILLSNCSKTPPLDEPTDLPLDITQTIALDSPTPSNELPLTKVEISTAKVIADNSETSQFEKTDLPENLNLSVKAIPETQTTAEKNVVYLGKYRGFNVIYFKAEDWNSYSSTTIYVQNSSGTWSEIYFESDTTPPTMPVIEFSEIKNRYELISTNSSTIMLYIYGFITEVDEEQLFFNFSYTDSAGDEDHIEGLVLFDLDQMKFKEVLTNIDFPNYRSNLNIFENRENFSIVNYYECSACDEAKSVMMIVNWEARTIKYLGEGRDMHASTFLDLEKKELTYKPQVFDEWQCEVLCDAQYTYLDEVTIKLP